MRVFAALPIPAAVADAVESLLPPVPDGMRAIPAGRWHITLAFYGDLDAVGVGCVRDRLRRRLIQQPAASLRLLGAGKFSGVAYLGVTGLGVFDEQRVREIAQICDRSGRACDAPGLGRAARFRAHITVARTRRRGTIDRDYLDRLSAVQSPVWRATRVQLLCSVLGPQPRYQLLASFPVA